MDFFPHVKSLDKLFNSEWKNFFYGEQSETWKEKLCSFGVEAWKQIVESLESRGRQLQNYWPLLSAFFVVSFIALATYKSLRYIGPIKLRKPDKCEQRAKEEICTEELRIISDDGDDDTESSAEKPCPTSRPVLDNATATSTDNDYHSRHDFSASSRTTVVTVEGNESGEFSRNLINSVKPGDDAVDHIASAKHSRDNVEENKEMPDLSESGREKVDSNNCKHFYVLTPWTGLPEEQESCAPTETLLPFLSDNAKTESLIHQQICSEIVKHEEPSKNVTDNSDLVKPVSPEAATVKSTSADEGKSTGQTTSESTDSTMAIQHESSSIYCADEALSRISDIGENITSRINIEKERELSIVPIIEPRSNDLERILSNFVQQLPVLNLSPISREPLVIESTVDIEESVAQTDARHRYRSLSHDNRSVRSSTGHADARRGCSASPTARNKSKRFVKHMQSKIPTPSPPAHRQTHQDLGTDRTLAETADHIRSVLLRKLKEVWAQHPRDRTPSPNRSINASLDSSVYYTPEGVSRIPLPRRSPRDSDTNDPTGSSRVSSQSDRSANQSGQSRSGYSGIRSDHSSAADALWVPLHSTPKTSPSSRGSRRER